MPQFTLSRLGVDRLGEAYPLIRSAARVSRERWEAFAGDLCEQGGGVLAVIAEDGRVHGVAAYRRTGSLRHESGLLIEVIATFELSGSGRARKALCAGLEETARSQGCRSLIFTMAASGYGDPSSRRRMSWEDLGLQMETVSFVQQISDPSEALRS
jgi:hypothetical protein